MPELDLGPNDYRKQDRRSGRWYVPDSPKACRNMLVVAIAILGLIWWTRAEGSRESLFGITALVAFAGGIMFAGWLKDRY